MQNKKTIEKTVHSYFNGQLAAAKEKELAEWIKADAENRMFFESVKARFDADSAKHDLLDQSWSGLQYRIYINSQFKARRKPDIKRLNTNFTRVAAVVLAIVGLSFVLAQLMPRIDQLNTEVSWFETVAPRGEKSVITLPDGSKVWLNSETGIQYPGNFIDGNRKIKLSGEAYFEVEKLKGSTFTVETKDYSVEVLGTKFNVMAYDDFDRTETSLIEGKVRVKHGQRSIEMKPGQELTFKENQFFLENKNTRQAMVWKDDIFDFDRIRLGELVKRLERWYDVEINMEDHGLKEEIYSGVFKNEETIWQVLSTLQLTLPINYERTGFREIEIKQKN